MPPHPRDAEPRIGVATVLVCHLTYLRPASWSARPARSRTRCCATGAEFGISYISVMEPHMEIFAKVILLLR
jgi:hypothetical protein